MVQPLKNTVFQFFPKLNIGLPYNIEIALLGIHSNELNTYLHKNQHTNVFITALFVMPKLGNHQDVLQ